MSIYKKVAFNTAIQITGKIVSTVIGLLSIAIIMRYLGREGFGEYTTAITFLSFFAVFADLGLTLVTAQMISLPTGEAGLHADEANQNKILGNLLGFRLITALLLLGLAPLAVLLFPYGPSIKLAVAVAAISFFFAALNQVLIGLFQKNLRLDRVSLAEIGGRLILFAGVFMAARYDFGLLGIMLATALASILNFSLLYVFSKNFANIRLAFDLAVWRQILKKSWPIGITIIFNLIYLRADTLILSLIKSQEEVGIYGATYRIIDVLVTLPFIFAGIVLPILTAIWQGQRDKFSLVLQRSFDLMAILSIPLVVGAQFVAVPVMTLVAGPEFAASGQVLRILILAAGIIFIGTVFSHAIIAIDRQKKIIKAYIFTAISSLAGYLIFIPSYSYTGAAWVTIYSETAIAFFCAILIHRYSGFLPDFKISSKALVASLVMALFLYFMPDLGLAVKVSGGALVYLFSLIALGAVKVNDLTELFAKPPTDATSIN